ncbi:MAG: hypothetical protein M3419_04170, partial [Actinomycetota bacterium]|nr:hypothetical protein [Actinomycetota bacterium]
MLIGCKALRSRRRPWTGALTVLVVSVLTLSLVPGAAAQEDPTPSRAEVTAAHAVVETTAEAVGRIKAELVAADQRVQDLQILAQMAVEAYNGARYELEQSELAAEQAQESLDRALSSAEGLKAELGARVAYDFQHGGAMADLSVVLRNSDPGDLLEDISINESYTSVLDAQLDEYTAQKVVTDVLTERAAAAVARRQEAHEAAQQRRAEAEAAVLEAEAEAAALAARKEALVVELAQVQDISVRLARQRQDALAAQAEQLAREQAERDAELLAQEQAEQEAPVLEPAPTPAPAPEPAPAPAPEPEPEPEPEP